MSALEFFYKNPPKLGNFIARKKSIEFKKTIIFGPPFSGKTTLAVEFIAKFERFLYVDLDDLRLCGEDVTANLSDFVRENKIDALCIDGATHEFDVECENIVIISKVKTLRARGYELLELSGLDYEEFIAFYSKNYSQMTLYNYFLAIGNSPACVLGQNNLPTMLRAQFDELELRILSKISSEISKQFNAFKIYKELKKIMKISKDKFYQTLQNLHLQGAIDFLPNLNEKAKFARIYFGDFALKSTLGFAKDPREIISNMVFCELKKFGEKIYFTQEIDFFMPQSKQAVLVAPFLSPEFAILRVKKQVERYLSLGVFHVIIVSNANDETTAFAGVKISVTPFWRWAAGIGV